MCYSFWLQSSGCGFILSLFSFHTYMQLFVGQRLDIGQRELVDLGDNGRYLYNKGKESESPLPIQHMVVQNIQQRNF